MRLTSDRLDVLEGEPLHAVAFVRVPEVSVLAAGGLPHLAHAIEDIGFRDVHVWDAAPAEWSRGRDVTTPGDLDWIVWLDATPIRSASLTRDLTSELSISDAWPARDDLAPHPGDSHPYAARCFTAQRDAVTWRVFGAAYPITIKEGAC